jgi:histidinol-phosphatase (PHP family)
MFYNPELKLYLEQMKIQQVYYLAPNQTAKGQGLAEGSELVYKTNASSETGSFQHVHIRAIPTASLNFCQSK